MSSRARVIFRMVFLALVIGVTVLGMLNVFGDNTAVKKQAMELVCGKPGCTVHVVKEERTPFSQSYGFQESRQSQRLIEIKCSRQFVLLGAYECQNMSPAER